MALLLLLATGALALSSHSPVDLESRPAFAVSFTQHAPILNETALELVADPTRHVHVLRTPSGQAFLCTVPTTAPESAPSSASTAASPRSLEDDRVRGIERGLGLLAPLAGHCLYLRQNWFTYSLCYGHEVRQFHAVHVAGNPVPQEDPNAEAYVLGVQPKPTRSVEVARHHTPSMIPSRLGDGIDDKARYLVQVWQDGTTCDKTGLPRTVEVQFHCNTQTIDRIALIRETSICRYVLLVHTPRLCAEPLFLEGGADDSSEPAAAIECRPIVSSDVHARLSAVAAAKNDDDGDGDGRPTLLEYSDEQPKRDGSDAEDRGTAVEAGSTGSLATPAAAADDRTHVRDSHGHDDDEFEYVDATVTVVYDPETGEIESVETAIDADGADDDFAFDDDLRGDDDDDEEDRSRVTAADHLREPPTRGTNRRDDDDDDAGRSRRQSEQRISVDQLEDMVRLMADSLSAAMKDSSSGRTRDRDLADPPPPPPTTNEDRDKDEDKVDVASLLKQVWGVDVVSREDLHRVAAARHAAVAAAASEDDDDQQKQKQQKRTPLLLQPRPRAAPPRNEAFEALKRGFETRYDVARDNDVDDDHRDERGRRARDEL
ncbi:hypothetical protein JCM11491_005382 [Sporobolomyces phaffii]